MKNNGDQVKIVFSDDFNENLEKAASDLNIDKKELLTALVEHHVLPMMVPSDANPPHIRVYTNEEHIELIVNMVKKMEASGELQPPKPDQTITH